MRNRLRFLLPVIDYLGSLFWILGFLLLVPLVVLFVSAGAGEEEVPFWCFVGPSAGAFALGWLMSRARHREALSSRGAMLVCALGWIMVSAVAAVPFSLALGVGYLDAYFETVSGFTTTGITMLHGLDDMPRSIIFWRAYIQWIGGLGILTFFLAVVSGAGSAHRLFGAESHKIFSRRPAPGLFHTLRILWGIYTGLTALVIVALVLCGMGFFDAICHGFTCIATGGYSPHDASIGYYRAAGYAHYVLIEYVVILGMVAGGTSFLIHYRLLTGDLRSLGDNVEVKLWWCILLAGTALVAVDHLSRFPLDDIGETVRCSLFQVVAIATTTGYATQDIRSDYFPAFSKQVFLVLMVIGGCVGSTGGGIKVLRIGVLLKMVGRQIKRIVRGRYAVEAVTVNGQRVSLEELRRVAALFFAWIVLLAFGSAVTAMVSGLGPLESASGMFSALGNIGPCYISGAQMVALSPIVKVTYILGMLAGRLEILPILMLFSRRTWQ